MIRRERTDGPGGGSMMRPPHPASGRGRGAALSSPQGGKLAGEGESVLNPNWVGGKGAGRGKGTTLSFGQEGGAPALGQSRCQGTVLSSPEAWKGGGVANRENLLEVLPPGGDGAVMRSRGKAGRDLGGVWDLLQCWWLRSPYETTPPGGGGPRACPGPPVACSLPAGAPEIFLRPGEGKMVNGSKMGKCK